MRRRTFLRGGLAAVAAPGALSLPTLGLLEERPLDRPRAGPIRLSSNENPLGAPESARRAIIEHLATSSQYPGRDGELIEAIAGKHGVRTGNVVLGAGSTDVLRMMVQAVVHAPDARLVVPEPTFEHVEAYAEPFFRDVVRVQLRPDHSLDLDAMRDAGRSARGEVLMFICNPNNPTGTITSCDDVEALVRSSPEKYMFLIDEAYFDFVADPGYRTLIPFTDRPNVVVSRTFSKVYGLAGLRVGYGIARAETVTRLRRFRLNNTVNALAEAAAIGCIGDDAFVRRSIDVNRRGRRIAQRTLAELELAMLPSHTNFVMHRIKGQVGEYITRMREAGIRVGRAFPPMLDHNRVSIGTPEEMENWAGTLREFRARGWV